MTSPLTTAAPTHPIPLRPALFRCMTTHIIPGIPLPIPWTFCRVTDSVQKTYFDVPPYTPGLCGRARPYYGSHREAQICCIQLESSTENSYIREYPYWQTYDAHCKPLFGGLVYKAPVTLPGFESLCLRFCSYPAVCGVLDSDRMAEALQRQTVRVYEDITFNSAPGRPRDA